MKNNTSRAAHALCIAAALVCASGLAYEKVDFSSRPLVAGNATIVESGYVVRREIGTVNFTPELRYPIELVYDSKRERKGLFGFVWHSPQLESSAAWDKDGMLWVSPWGEKFKFFHKDEKTPKDAIKLAPVEDAKKGVGYYSPYAEWEANTSAADATAARDWTIAGKRGMKGWIFVYADAKLSKITAPSGRSVEFIYKDEELASIAQDGTAFVEVAYTEGGNVASVAVNGVRTAFSYESATLEIQPKTKDGSVRHPVCPRLVAMQRGSLAPESYSYSGNFLASAKCGRREQTFRADAAGRLLSDADFTYAYAKDGTVSLKNKAGETASYRYDKNRGIFDIAEFSGRKSSISYFMRYDVAYLGKVHIVRDGKNRRVATVNYDDKSGCVTRVRDIFGNDRNFEYDAEGRLAKTTRRACGRDTVEPVAAYAYDKSGNLASVMALDGKGGVYSKKMFAYSTTDRRPTRIDDGQNAVTIAYNKFGYPKSVADAIGNVTKISYDKYNTPVASRDRNGIETRCVRSDAGLVTRIERRAGDELLSSIDVAYDEAGRPVAYTDQDGLCKAFDRKAFDRDEFGRVVVERFPDGSTVGYQYDAVGRLATVTDENGHDIRFDWSRFGLASRTTAAGQLTDYVRGADGLLAKVVSSQHGREDRAISRKYDKYDRLVELDYGNGEKETFQYDEWNRIAKHTRGASSEDYWYDHFGRLVEKVEDGVSTQYAYDRHGNRIHRMTLDSRDEIVSEEFCRYDRFGRLVESESGEQSVKYIYDDKGHLAKQVLGKNSVVFEYTKLGQLKSKQFLNAKGIAIGSLYYYYSKSGLAQRGATGKRRGRAAHSIIFMRRPQSRGDSMRMILMARADANHGQRMSLDLMKPT